MVQSDVIPKKSQENNQKNQPERNPPEMKTIIMRTEKSSRWGAMLLATVVAIITSLAVANATQTITTPNAVKITYNLASGASSAAITPATNTSVLVMGCCTTEGGVGHVSLMHIPSTIIEWVGLESNNAAAITQGATKAAHHMVYINASHTVDIQVASADTIVIHNAHPTVQAGNVTLIW